MMGGGGPPSFMDETGMYGSIAHQSSGTNKVPYFTM